MWPLSFVWQGPHLSKVETWRDGNATTKPNTRQPNGGHNARDTKANGNTNRFANRYDSRPEHHLSHGGYWSLNMSNRSPSFLLTILDCYECGEKHEIGPTTILTPSGLSIPLTCQTNNSANTTMLMLSLFQRTSADVNAQSNGDDGSKNI